METKIDLRKIKEFLIGLGFLTFIFGGWVLYFFSEVSWNRREAARMRAEAEDIINEMHRKDSIFSAQYKDFELPPK